MTITVAREKLLDYVENADEVIIFELLSLFENNEVNNDKYYDEATIKMLNQRSADYLSGKTKTFTIKETMKHISQYRMLNGKL